jgi:hypothetical protein
MINSQLQQYAEAYLQLELCAVPCRADKFPALEKWTHLQYRRPEPNELNYAASEYLGIICGQTSGNLEVIDVDVKYDITGKLRETLLNMLPDELSYVVETPSGGLHIYYRLLDMPVPGNHHIARRPTTEEEKDADLKAGKKLSRCKTIIETRGEGGFVVAPPSKGYRILDDRDRIPSITVEDRELVMSICQAFNTYTEEPIIKKDASIEPRTYSGDGESPWRVYNREGREHLINEFLKFGFKVPFEHNGKTFLRHPHATSKTSGNINNQDVYFFSPNVPGFNPNEGYCFARAYAALHDINTSDDKQWKKMYDDFRAAGFGNRFIPEPKGKSVNSSLKKNKESSDVKEESRGDTDDPLYGITWLKKHVFLTPSVVSSNKFAHVLVDNNNVCYYFESISTGKPSEPLRQKIAKIQDVDEWPKFSNEGLDLFDESWIQRDTETECYLYYQNGTVRVTANEVDFRNGKDRPMIWASLVLPRDYKHSDEVHEISIIAQNATVNYKSLQIGLGFLLHRHWRRNAAKIVWSVDHKPASKNDGRRGKDLLTTLVSLCRKWTAVKWKPGHNFWTSSIQPDTTIVHFEDVDNKLSIDEEMKRTITGDLNIEHKGSNILTRKFNDKPKFSASSQRMPFDYMDNSIRGRIWLIEFTDYLQKNPPKNVLVYDDKDLSSFDAWMIDCIQTYFKNQTLLVGCPPITPEQREEMYRITYGSNIITAVKEVQNVLYVDGFIPAEDLINILDCSNTDHKTINRFKDAYEKIVGVKVTRVRRQEKSERLWGYSEEKTKVANQPKNEGTPF